jgi:hypothetical protein
MPPNADRVKEIEDEIDKLHFEQLQDDAAYRRDLAHARRTGRGHAFLAKTSDYVRRCNERGRQLQEFETEMVT